MISFPVSVNVGDKCSAVETISEYHLLKCFISYKMMKLNILQNYLQNNGNASK